MDCVLLDFSKTFDKVSHQRLLLKLHYYGVRGPILEWIKSFLHKRTQQVLVNSKSSKEAPVLSGVLQGTELSPLFFSAYINDMPAYVTSNIKLFADDSLLYHRIRRQPAVPQNQTTACCTTGSDDSLLYRRIRRQPAVPQNQTTACCTAGSAVEQIMCACRKTWTSYKNG